MPIIPSTFTGDEAIPAFKGAGERTGCSGDGTGMDGGVKTGGEGAAGGVTGTLSNNGAPQKVQK